MVTIVLHTHLPKVLHHGTWPHGSDWLCEAVAECYIPLLSMCDRLMADGIRPGITFDISPVLCEQLAHPDFPDLFIRYCEEHISLATVDAEHVATDVGTAAVSELAVRWAQWYEDKIQTFVNDFHKNILGQFKRLQDNGAIELMTCGATHGYLALVAEDASVDLQIRVAVDAHTRHFGKRPRGIWLPECAYRPGYAWRTLLPVASYAVPRMRKGIEEFLAEYGLDYFVADQGALQSAAPIGVRGVDGSRTPYRDTYGAARVELDERSPFTVFRAASENSEKYAAVLVRHMQIALQVWSGKTGYPGDPDYLDFHKKYFRSSHRYWRVTDVQADMADKQPYVPEWAQVKAESHARHFVKILEVALQHRMSSTDLPTAVCLPFDTELFGHWWFEGPHFLEHVLRGIHASAVIRTTTAAEHVAMGDRGLELRFPESSWGRNGDHSVWMNPETEWTWEKEYTLEHRVRRLFEKHSNKLSDPHALRIARVLLSQTLLTQSSDWQFLISTFSAKEYAEMRFHSHHADAVRSADILERYCVTQKLTKADDVFLSECEKRDMIFENELTVFLTGAASGETHS